MPLNPKRSTRKLTIAVIVAVALIAALEFALLLFRATPPPPAESPAKAADQIRLAALGGSVVAGIPIPKLGFISQLEHALPRSIEIINFAEAHTGSRGVLEQLTRALDAKADAVIVLIGHEEFIDAHPQTGWRAAIQRLRTRSALAEAIAETLDPRVASPDTWPQELPPIDPSGHYALGVRRGFARNLARLVTRTEAAGVPLFLLTAPSNLSDWGPALHRVRWRPTRPRFESEVTQLRRRIERGEGAEALRILRKEPTAAPNDPNIRFLEGRALVRVGRPREAQRAFIRARDRDAFPRRSLSDFNDRIRAAVVHDHVHVIDAEHQFRESSHHGLIGFALVADAIHPTPLGNAILASGVAKTIRDRTQWIPSDHSLLAPEALASSVRHTLGDAKIQRRTHVEWLLATAINAMKPPGFKGHAAKRYLIEARALAPDEWRIHANIATIELLWGDVDAGASALQAATRAKGHRLDPEDIASTPYLKRALEASGTPLPTGASEN